LVLLAALQPWVFVPWVSSCRRSPRAPELKRFFNRVSTPPRQIIENAVYGAAGIAQHAGVTRLLLERGADPNDEEIRGGGTLFGRGVCRGTAVAALVRFGRTPPISRSPDADSVRSTSTSAHPIRMALPRRSRARYRDSGSCARSRRLRPTRRRRCRSATSGYRPPRCRRHRAPQRCAGIRHRPGGQTNPIGPATALAGGRVT
jgi:hypothetical protein